MHTKSLAIMAATMLLSAAPLAASAEELIVYHGWSSKAEVAALNIMQGALNEKGHTWKDLAIPHNSGVNVSIVNMVTGGDPPNAFVTSDPHIFRDLAGLGLERDLTDYYKEIGAADNFFPIVQELSTVDGKMVKVPLFLHIDGMVYWNMEVAKTAGVDPTAWKNVDEMIAIAKKYSPAIEPPWLTTRSAASSMNERNSRTPPAVLKSKSMRVCTQPWPKCP